ncbi:MAG: ATP-binding cassette domain-containing protein [Planctomycetota bacterium]
MIRDRRKPQEPASLALAHLVRAAGQGLALPSLHLPGEGQVPVDAVEWLRHAAGEGGLPLEPVDATPAELLGWVESDVPLLSALEDHPFAGPAEARWVVVERGDVEGEVSVTTIDGAGASTRTVAADDGGDDLGLGNGRRRWLRIDVGAVALGSQVGEQSLPPLQRLRAILRPDRRDLIAVAVFAVAIGVLLLATPIAVQAVVNYVALGAAIPPLIVVTVLLFLGLCFAGLLSALQTWVVEVLQRRVFVRSVADIAARLPRVALGSAGNRYGPELVNRYFDLQTIQKQGSFLLLDGLSVLLSVTIGLTLLAFYHPILLAFDLVLVLAIALIVLGPIRRGIRTAKAESGAKYVMAGWLEEIARNPILFKSSDVMKSVFEQTDRLAHDYVAARKAHFRIAFGQGVAALALQAFASTALLALGGWLVIRGSLTLGQLVAAELVLAVVVSSVAKIGKHLEAFYDLLAATDKVGVLLGLPVERSGGEHHLPGADGRGAALELRAVGWAPPGGATLFDGVDLGIAPGERVGLCGPSAAGKSTLLQLIWGLLEPRSGVIRVDDRDVRELSLDSLRRSAVLVDRVELIHGTIRENVDLARPLVSGQDVRRALRKVGLLDEISRLPRGIDEPLGADGRPLSSGQAVRLQVARAIATRPRLLLVTDVFEHLGEDERERVFDALFDRDAPWTLVLVSSNQAALSRCDRNFCLEGGALRELEPALH